MVFGSQRDFNRFIGNYIDRLPSERLESRGYATPKPKQAPALDKTEQLVEKELERVEDNEVQEGFFTKVKVFFLGRKPADDGVKDVSDVDSYIEKVKPEPAAPRQRVQAAYAQRAPQSFEKTGFTPARRVESVVASTYAKKFEFNPDSEKDIKYLTGLIESLIRKINTGERDKFIRSSEYRIYQDVKIRHS
jgi:hypothetical protein